MLNTGSQSQDVVNEIKALSVSLEFGSGKNNVKKHKQYSIRAKFTKLLMFWYYQTSRENINLILYFKVGVPFFKLSLVHNHSQSFGNFDNSLAYKIILS